MTIEHRFGASCDVDVEVLVGRDGNGLFRARVESLSMHGMRLETNWGSVPLDLEVEIYMWVDGRLRVIPAVIVSSDDAGFGIWFLNLSSDAYQSLHRLAHGLAHAAAVDGLAQAQVPTAALGA